MIHIWGVTRPDSQTHSSQIPERASWSIVDTVKVDVNLLWDFDIYDIINYSDPVATRWLPHEYHNFKLVARSIVAAADFRHGTSAELPDPCRKV